jgi:hypothetical protein
MVRLQYLKLVWLMFWFFLVGAEAARMTLVVAVVAGVLVV